ncbi:hypothetical protein NDN08_001826 [Rhodosorus marinus]|uniref:Uncharacterized protein n=1 Tax=Rhodosorus marinus TaxID=101924 RepID=A0AAV8UTE4_9RHOD|nr:hypothetical protein NDN08_001826 [Rhodosorus marinus]
MERRATVTSALLLASATICCAAPLRSRETPTSTVEPIALIESPTKDVNSTCADDVTRWKTNTLENRLEWDLFDPYGSRLGGIEAVGVSKDPATGVRGIQISLRVNWPLAVYRARISVDTEQTEIGPFNTQVDDLPGSALAEYWVSLSSINGACCNNHVYIAATLVVEDTISGFKESAMTSTAPYRTECSFGLNWNAPTCSVVMLCYDH